jgi:hypothetical protein
MLSFDLAGGATRNAAGRTGNATGSMLQNGAASGCFVSMHGRFR